MKIEPDPDMTCAVVGMAGRFADTISIDSYWTDLLRGRHFGRRISRTELETAGISKTVLDDPRYVPVCASLRGPFEFDPELFNLRLGEAQSIDPQQRLFLEVAWQALEEAGALAGVRNRKVGVFAAASPSEWRMGEFVEVSDRVVEELGRLPDFLATRVAFLLDLHGPAITVSTACSSSLVALHLAATSLLARESDLALAGGVALRQPTVRGHLYEPGSIYSADGTCRSYDEESTGTFSGDGAGAVVLKRLSDALRDKDLIYALVLGTAINNDGRRKASFAAPSVEGQASLASSTLKVAQVRPEQIGFIEGHGTGTRLGDPVEVAALAAVWRGSKGRTLLGSVKSNIGHLDAASGIASFIKATLAIHHKIIPGTAWFRVPNREINLSATPFEVTSETRPIENDAAVLVHNLGLGGTNAGAVLAPADVAAGPILGYPFILPISARSMAAVERNHQLVEAISLKESHLGGVASTLQFARSTFDMRSALVISDSQTRSRLPVRQAKKNASRMVFAAPGGGSWSHASWKAIAIIPAAESHLEAARRAIFQCIAVDLGEIDATSPSEHCFAAIVALGITVGRTLSTLGIQPDLLIGLSLGEITAAALAGVFSMEAAIGLAATRGRLFDQTSEGCAFAVDTDAANAATLIQSFAGLGVAVNAGMGSCVISGDVKEAKVAMAMLVRHGYQVRQLALGGAPHSPKMGEVRPAFESAVASVSFNAPTIRVISSLDGEDLGRRGSDPKHWGAHLRQINRWDLCLQRLGSGDIVVDLGPSRTLSASLLASNLDAVNAMPHELDEGPPTMAFTEAVAAIWTRGGNVAWSRWGLHATRVAAPISPLERISVPYGSTMPRATPKSTGVGLWDIRWTQCPVSPKRDGARIKIQGTGCVASALRAALLDSRHVDAEGGSDADVTICACDCHDSVPERMLTGLFSTTGMVCLVTSQGVSVGGDVKTFPLAAALHAFAKTVAQELPSSQIAGIDVTPTADWRQVLDEAINRKAPKWRAIRSGRVFRSDIARVESGESLNFLPGGTYLFIGGLGKYGQHLARTAAKSGATSIICITRQLVAKIAGVRELKQDLSANGTSLTVIEADAARPGELAKIIDQLLSRGARLDGIIHLAAELNAKSAFAPLSDFSLNAFSLAWEEQMRPKLHVAQALAKATEGRDPPFVVVFSSNAAILGGPALAFYAAANAAVDALCLELRAQGRPWTSIRWDGWRLGTIELPSSLECVALTGDEAIELFARGVGSGLGAVSACRGSLDDRWEQWVENPSMMTTLESEFQKEIIPSALFDGWTTLEREIAEMCLALMAEPIPDRTTNLIRFGFDSLNLMRLRLRIATKCKLDFPLSLLLKNCTIASMALALTQLNENRK